jgi:hypothetical protein
VTGIAPSRIAQPTISTIGRAAHWTGRNASGHYLDKPLQGPLTGQQHSTEHQVWNFLGIGDGCDGCRNWLRLKRAGAHLARMGEANDGGVVILPAKTVRQLGLVLGDIADDIDCGGKCARSPDD